MKSFEFVLTCYSLAPLSTKVSEKTFGSIIDGPSGLSKNIFSTKKDSEETKDISTIGLKFIIGEVPETATTSVNILLTRLAPKLIEQIQVRNLLVHDTYLLESLCGRHRLVLFGYHQRFIRKVGPRNG